MRPSILTASAAILSLTTGLARAIPQFGTPSSSPVPPTATSAVAAPRGTVACNNSPDLCNRNYDNITHMGSHNIAFLRDESTSFSVAGNTFYNATIALSAGVRLLSSQVHYENGTLRLCHTSCELLDGGTLESWLSRIKTWMDANPNEVVSLLLVNGDRRSAADFGAAFQESGISRYGYTPESVTAMSTWPTLQTLISANSRLVTFITTIDYNTAFPYLLPEFSHIFETEFDVTSSSGFNCTVARPEFLASRTGASAVSAGYMSLMNHFQYSEMAFGISIPAAQLIEQTNSPATEVTGALGTHAAQCNAEWQSRPTFILVDFFNVGPAIQVADNLNGITPTGRIVPSRAPLSVGSSGGVRRESRSWFGVAAMVICVVVLGNFVWL